MNRRTFLKTLTAAGLWPAHARAGSDRLPLRALYVGKAKSARADDYAAFLRRHCAHADVADRDGFEPVAAKDADVVLLDWSQPDGDLRTAACPLGKFEAWAKPTVLLGSAGLLVAAKWSLIGGAG